MKLSVVLAAAVLCGCGGSSPHERLVGSWILVLNPANDTGAFVEFQADGTYKRGSMLALEVQVENGTYVASDATVTTTPTASSCAGPDPSMTTSYGFSGPYLTLRDLTG